eukprot:gene6904-11066_t
MKLFGLVIKSIEEFKKEEEKEEKFYFSVVFSLGLQKFEKRSEFFTIEDNKTEINQMIKFLGYDGEKSKLQMKNEKDEIIWSSDFQISEGDKIEALDVQNQQSTYIQYSIESTNFEWDNELEKFIEIENSFIEFDKERRIQIEEINQELKDLKYELQVKNQQIKQKEKTHQEEIEKQLKLMISLESRLKDVNLDDSSLDLKQQNQVLNQKIEAMTMLLNDLKFQLDEYSSFERENKELKKKLEKFQSFQFEKNFDVEEFEEERLETNPLNCLKEGITELMEFISFTLSNGKGKSISDVSNSQNNPKIQQYFDLKILPPLLIFTKKDLCTSWLKEIHFWKLIDEMDDEIILYIKKKTKEDLEPFFKKKQMNIHEQYEALTLCFIKHCINDQNIIHCFQKISMDKEKISRYFTPESSLSNTKTFLKILKVLKILTKIKITINPISHMVKKEQEDQEKENESFFSTTLNSMKIWK